MKTEDRIDLETEKDVLMMELEQNLKASHLDEDDRLRMRRRVVAIQVALGYRKGSKS